MLLVPPDYGVGCLKNQTISKGVSQTERSLVRFLPARRFQSTRSGLAMKAGTLTLFVAFFTLVVITETG